MRMFELRDERRAAPTSGKNPPKEGAPRGRGPERSGEGGSIASLSPALLPLICRGIFRHGRNHQFDSAERDLGLDARITRRDFLDASLLAAGSVLLRRPAPLPPPGARRQSRLGRLRRRRRLRALARQHVGGDDGRARPARRQAQGRRRAERSDSGERYDLIVVGGGLSGLGAAYFFQKQRGGKVPRARQPSDGGWRGEAERVRGGRRAPDRAAGLERFRDAAPSGLGRATTGRTSGCPQGADAFEHQAWAPGVKPLEIARDHYYFQLWADEFASHGFYFAEADGSLRLVRDAFRAGLKDTPWPEPLRSDFLRWRSNPKVYDGADCAVARHHDLRAAPRPRDQARPRGGALRRSDSRGCRRRPRAAT